MFRDSPGEMKPKKVKPGARRERQWPAVERVVSTNFPDVFDKIQGKCYVPLEDYRKLERKYLKMFDRYQEAIGHNRLKVMLLTELCKIVEDHQNEQDGRSNGDGETDVRV
jgi:hypothetical protein